MKPLPETVAEAKAIRRQFRLIILTSLVTLAIGTSAMMYLEKLSLIDALYFSVVSLTTVGYGDITPHTTPGKLFVMGYLLVGIGIIAALVNTVLRNAVARRVITRSEKDIKEVKTVVESARER